VVVIGHQAVCPHLNPIRLAGLLMLSSIGKAISITAERILSAIASLDNMMRVAGGYHAGSARHSEALVL